MEKVVLHHVPKTAIVTDPVTIVKTIANAEDRAKNAWQLVQSSGEWLNALAAATTSSLSLAMAM